MNIGNSLGSSLNASLQAKLSQGNTSYKNMMSDAATKNQSILDLDAAQQADIQSGNVLQTFGTILNTEMGNINNLNATANQSVETYATGGDIELHNVILAVEKADMALQLATQVRNRILGAYQEISRMNV